jgi:transcription antitermination factor NusG
VCYWAAVRCPPQREIAIAKRLEGLGCVIYLPRARMLLRRSVRPSTVPLYATYLFADVDRGPSWQAIRRQPGVISIVMTGDQPSRCPESEILKLKAAEVDGVVRLARAPAPWRYRPSMGEPGGSVSGRSMAGKGDMQARGGIWLRCWSRCSGDKWSCSSPPTRSRRKQAEEP